MGNLAPFIQPEEASEAMPMAKIFLQVTIFLCNFIVSLFLSKSDFLNHYHTYYIFPKEPQPLHSLPEGRGKQNETKHMFLLM